MRGGGGSRRRRGQVTEAECWEVEPGVASETCRDGWPCDDSEPRRLNMRKYAQGVGREIGFTFEPPNLERTNNARRRSIQCGKQ